MERRDPRRHHAGGVHPAHRSRRSPRHRRRGTRCRAVAAGPGPQGRGRARLDAYLPAQVVLPPVVQHGGQPRAPVRPRPRARAARSRPSPSSRPTRPSSGWPASCARARTRSTGTPTPPPATSATSWSTPGCATRSRRPRRDLAKSRQVRPAPGGRRLARGAAPRRRDRGARRPLRRHGRGDRPRARAPTATGRARYVLTADRHARRLSLIDFPTPVGSITRVKVPRRLQRAQPAGAARPGLDPAQPHPQPDAAARARASTPGPPAGGTRSRTSRIEDLRRQLRAHPCHGCPDREDHARWAERLLQARPRRATPSSAASSSARTPSRASSTASATC